MTNKNRIIPTLILFFILILSIQTVAGWYDFASWKRVNGATPQMFGPDGFVWSWARENFRVWQAQLLMFICLLCGVNYITHRTKSEFTQEINASTNEIRQLNQNQREIIRQMEQINRTLQQLNTTINEKQRRRGELNAQEK